MTDLKIRVFKGGEAQPETTVTIPGGVLKVASKLIPKQAAAALQNKGIDLDELIKLSTNPEINGTLVEVEEHKKNEKVVISLEQHREPFVEQTVQTDGRLRASKLTATFASRAIPL